MRPTRTVFLAISLVTLAAAAGCRRGDAEAAGPAAAAPGGAPAVLQFYKDPQPLPAFSLRTLDGRTISSSELRGKVTLINFWATWCGPCRAEIPDLIALQNKYKNELQVIGISEDEAPPEAVKQFVAAHKMNYAVAMSTPEIEKLFPGTVALPTSVLVDRDGRIVQRHVGMLTAARTEMETRSLAGLTVNATVERIDRAQRLKLPASAQAIDIPGIDLKNLPQDKRTAALEKLNSDGCTCGCDLTVARCRIEDPTCGVSLPLARQIVQQIAAR